MHENNETEPVATGRSASRPLFTCFTPTRNRAELIHRTYESLTAQTLQDFEWLVIDNCSTDGTAELIAKWQEKASFPIRYIRREQDGGLASSYRMAFQEARGEFFIAMRDADTCVPTALERFKFLWESIPASQRDSFVGVTVNVVNEDGRLDGTEYPAPVVDSDFSDSSYRLKVTGEKWGCQRTEVLRAHASPVVPGYTGYIPEGVVWRRIARHYRTRYVNEALRVYYINVANRQSVNPKPWASAYGGLIDAGDALSLDLRWFRFAPVRFAYLAMKYARLSFHLGRSPSVQWRRLPNAGARLLWLLVLPAAWIAYACDDRRRESLGEPRSADFG